MVNGNDVLMPKMGGFTSSGLSLMPPQSEVSALTVLCHPDDFSASVLARAVEDSDAHLISLGIADAGLDDGRVAVELRTNRPNAASTARSLERYGFEVLAVSAPEAMAELPDETLRTRAAELLHIINI